MGVTGQAPFLHPVSWRPRPVVSALLALALVAAGCAPRLALRRAGLPEAARVEGVPVIRQTRNHCGPAALAMVLAWAGRPADPADLGPLVYTPARKGTFPSDLAREARGRGLLAWRVPPQPESLFAEVAAGHPVLVLENRGLSWAPVYHYSVLVGYGPGGVILHAGGELPEEVATGTFVRTWLRAGGFGLVVLPPGELPATAGPEDVLDALADLEEAGRTAEAARGYRAFLARWPEDWRGAFGWGNALWAAGDLAGAEAALRRAHATAPERPEPLNNLALVLARLGRRDEARAVARMAVEAAERLGLDPGPYRETERQAGTVGR
ncbi:PA2778 family cysteine peptidase [Deferrisoma camini]|uniref:PA2778 family cysteine peptidase n=1 Tax=Deferrisoma camini TaxID=1035120 RepID=UPI00046CCEBB|nr:PA2778 family cysteine peptidase [Deferrisoma camini]